MKRCPFDYKSFRYLQVTFRNMAEPAQLRSVSANRIYYPAPVRGSFSCSDAMLTKLWGACADTTALCTDDGFMDSPLREKRNWLGDGSHALLGTYAAFGNTDLVKRYFRLTSQGGLGDGLLRMFFPGSDLYRKHTKILSNIPQHSLVWAARIWEHYRYFGHRELLHGMYPTLTALSAWCDRHTDSNGLLADLPYWNWLDWTPMDLRGVNLGTNAFYLNMLDDLARIASEMGRPEEASAWQETADRVRSALRRLFWDEQAGLYLDSYYQGGLTGVRSELGNGLALLFGIADRDQCARIAGHFSKATGNMAPVTPLFFHYVAQGLSAAERPDLALDLIRRRYAPMMDKMDTVCEGWYPFVVSRPIEAGEAGVSAAVPDSKLAAPRSRYRSSAVALAHCAGTPVSFVLLTEIVGIRPAAPGFATCTLHPQVSLLDSARGSFPSDRGDIAVGWTRGEGAVDLEVTLPGELNADLYLTLGDLPAGVSVIRLDGAEHRCEAGCDVASPLRREGERLVVSLTGGPHRVEVR